MLNPANWQDRLLSYLCWMYDSLHRGEDYKETNRALHIENGTDVVPCTQM